MRADQKPSRQYSLHRLTNYTNGNAAQVQYAYDLRSLPTITYPGTLSLSEGYDGNRQLRRELHLSRRPPGYFVPIDLVMSRLGATNRPNLKVLN